MPAKAKTSTAPKKLPTAKEMEKLRQKDDGFVLAKQDAVKFLYGRRQAVYNIARHYHLDPEELLQEGYEVLLTCLRDYTPVYQKASGEIVSVQFTTFFGSRMDSRAMEMRNRDPEYQARQAYTSDMSDEERARFRADPPLLVQHLDQETAVQEALRSEASAARENLTGDAALKVARDSFFDRKLNELVAKEADDKKRAALMHVKVGGVFNFQEMAYHFGVTDSRASQILNELMDAFYVQRLIDGSVESVAYDFKKLKFNEKRALRLLKEAFFNTAEERQAKIVSVFEADYPHVKELAAGEEEAAAGGTEQDLASLPAIKSVALQPFNEGLSAEEEAQYPLVGKQEWATDKLMSLNCDFRPPLENTQTPPYIGKMMEQDPTAYPLLVNEAGWVVDGQRRLAEAKRRGLKKLTCLVRQVPDEKTAKILRVGLNNRIHQTDKLDLYWSIGALAELGLSQQKIADALGTSRTNVIVYIKVRDKVAPVLRQLFEDGLIQITNASSCTEFSDKVQERVAAFIRTYGAGWGKGSQFAELHTAAADGKLSQLEKKVAASQPASLPPVVTPHSRDEVPGMAENAVLERMSERLNSYEQSLKDAEIWTAQRESIITRQTEELTDARSEIEALKKELEAAELTRYGDEATIQEALKELKDFYALTERVTGALHNIKQVGKQVRHSRLTRKQLLEIQDMTDELEQHVNALRVELATKAGVKFTQ